ncbi:eCIS core domain-containing protein [Streptomyces sp. BBFR102]|uniref:eCIS core domain-containing protein n=1 Tax=Streptomyces sp. BBFR102 TaxID=3448171 RepID=UPI003F53255D
MHDRAHAKPTAARNSRVPVRTPAVDAPTRPLGPASPQGLLALQRTAGNAAVVQTLRQAGHLPEQHQHGAGCGHQPAGQPQVQRSAVHDVLRSGGQPLSGTVRADMEARLGADFSDVRIHNDSAAKASAAEVGARAYTSGRHVVIGDGGADRHTLAHELTHVIQQRQGPVAGTDNGAGLKVSDPSDRFEREAEANATRALSGPAPARATDHGQGHDHGPGHAAHAEAQVQRVQEDGPQLSISPGSISEGTYAYKGGTITAADFATVAKAQAGKRGDDWHACYFGSEVEVSLGYMVPTDEQLENHMASGKRRMPDIGLTLLAARLTKGLKVLDITGSAADSEDMDGASKAALIKEQLGIPQGTTLMEWAAANQYAVRMSSAQNATTKEIIVPWELVTQYFKAVTASEQPTWNEREMKYEGGSHTP